MLNTLGLTADAIALLEQRATYFEHSAAVRDTLGQLYVQQGRSNEAVTQFRKASLLAPEDLDIRTRLARTAVSVGDNEEAIIALVRLVNVPDPNPEHIQLLAKAYFNNGETASAIRWLENLTQRDAENVAAWVDLSRACVSNGDLRRAELAARRATGLTHNDPDTLMLLATILIKADRPNDALGVLSDAAKQMPGDATPLLLSGLCQERLGRLDEASRFYQKAANMDQSDPLARRAIASTPTD